MKKRIAFVISSLDLGGAQRGLSNVIMALPDNYDIDIILNDDSNIVYPYRGNIISLGIKNPDDRTNLIYQIKVFIKRFNYLRKLKKNNNYDSVISFLDSANIANIISGNKNSKTVISAQNNLSGKKGWKYNFIVKPFVRLLYNKADLIVSLSEGVTKDLVCNYNIKKNKVKTIYNGFDIEFILNRANDNCNLSINNKCMNFITVGRLTHQKGQWHLIRVFAELYKKNKNIKLYILGIGELEGYLKNLIKEYKLEKAVFLAGFCENPYSILSKMDIYVFPSLYEGFGNALVEAMACGLPCIVTDYESGAREILSPQYDKRVDDILLAEYGILVPNMSQDYPTNKTNLDLSEVCLKNAMERLIEDETLRKHYSEKSKERADFFSLNKMGKAWDEII